MSKLNKAFSLLSVVFAVLTFSLLAHGIWRYIQKWNLYSCVNSIGSDVVEYDSARQYALSAESWYVLTDTEAKTVLKDKYFANCSGSESQPQDIKERNLKVAVKKIAESGYQVMVWSKGFDNISGTDDDIVFPEGEQIPK